MSGFLISDFNRTGRAGKITDVGKRGELPGASKTMNLGQSTSGGNSGSNGSSNITRGLKFSDINKKESARFRSPNTLSLKESLTERMQKNRIESRFCSLYPGLLS
jgi:hypothetical protein